VTTERADTGPAGANVTSEGAPVLEIVRRHAAGIVLALVLAGLLVAPRWWTLAGGAGDGERVSVSPYAAGAVGYDEALYTASVRAAFDGAIPVRDPFLINHRDSGPPQRSAIPHALIGATGSLLGDPFVALSLFTTVSAVVAMLVLYALMLTLTGSRLAAVALLPAALFAVHVLNFAGGILPLRHTDVLSAIARVDPNDQVHAWTRFPAPILVLAPFFAAALALPRAVTAPSRTWTLAAAVAIALLIYTYVYYWTALGLAMSGWLVALLVEGRRAEARRLLEISLLALLLALPELIILGWAAIDLPADARDRVGLQGPGIDLALATTVAQRLLVGAPFVAALLRRRSPGNVLFVALFLSPLALTPIEGLVPQPWHYHTQVWGVFAIPAVVAGGVAITSSLRFPQAPRAAYTVAAVIALTSAGYIAALQTRAITDSSAGYVLSSDEKMAFAWMRDHLDEGDTVVTPSVSTNLLLASLTPAYQYLADGGFTYADDDELSERMLRVQAAYGYREEDAMRRVSLADEFEGFPLNDPGPGIAEQERLLEGHLAFFLFSFEILDRDTFTRRAQDEWLARYRELLATDDPLQAYPAEYIYCGPRERYFDAAAPARGTYVRVAFSHGDVTLYERVEAGAGSTEFAGCVLRGSAP